MPLPDGLPFALTPMTTSVPTELTFFTVEGHWYDIQAADPAGSTNTPQLDVIYAFITFTPRLKPGTVVYLNITLPDTTTANTAIAIAPVTARIINGELSVIDRTDTPDIQLVANTTNLGLTNPLIYDVSFTNVTYNNATQTLQNFAFTAPTTAATLDLCNPALTRLKYDPTNYPT